jgi:hypothetical protein
MDHDMPAFAVQTIRRWWHEIGQILSANSGWLG